MTERSEQVVLPGRGWHPEYIKAELRKRFGTMSALSVKLKVSRQAISGVISNPLASMRLEKQLAEALEVSPYAIWPARWKPNGEPFTRTERSRIIQDVQNEPGGQPL